MNPIRVLIVEDSPVVGEHLRRIISADRRFEVAGVATSGEEALAVVDQISPDVISMDIHLPGIQGFEATRRIMAHHPTPIVVVSGIDMEEMSLTMQALRAGALAVVEKPVSGSHQDYTSLAGKLCTQLAIMSEVKVVRQRQAPSPHTGNGAPTRTGRASDYRLLGIAASTGGPNALLQMLSGLGRDFSLPIVVVQHMTAAFLQGFAEWLTGVTPFSVSVIHEPTELSAGRVYLAPSNRSHLVINGLAASLDDGPPVGGQRPSANILFSSMAQSLRSSAIGVLLTGMGEDGATGLRDLKRAGSFTIGEDESTAIVYGMPAAAARIGGLSESLPLGDIAPRVLSLTSLKRETL
jgi:two-component system, chemotaxis family, protein-glutamate methylesterase/glutaminase